MNSAIVSTSLRPKFTQAGQVNDELGQSGVDIIFDFGLDDEEEGVKDTGKVTRELGDKTNAVMNPAIYGGCLPLWRREKFVRKRHFATYLEAIIRPRCCLPTVISRNCSVAFLRFSESVKITTKFLNAHQYCYALV